MTHAVRILQVLLSFTILTAGCSRDVKKDEIVIGVFASLTGKYSHYGISSKNGIELAVEQANTAGGVLGRRIRLAIEDDRSVANNNCLPVRRHVLCNG